MTSNRIGWICGVLAVCVGAAAWGDTRVIDIQTHQGKKNDTMTQWSKEFSGPEGFRITNVEVWQRNAIGGGDNVTDDWTAGVQNTERGDKNLIMTPDTPVPYCTTLIFRVTLNATTIGVDPASDRQYSSEHYSVRSTIDVPGIYHTTLDSACYAGGPTGRTIPELGLIIPANEYAYLYQVNNVGGGARMNGFALKDAHYFHDLGYLSASHNGEAEFDNITDYDSGEALEDCGMPLWTGLGDPSTSVVPYYWMTETDSLGDFWATAQFWPETIDNGESSVVLVAFSRTPPRDWGDAPAFVGCEPSFGMYANWGTALAPAPIPGDANGDGKIDGSDLAIWQQGYDPLGDNDHAYEAFYHGDYDVNGVIDGADLALWQQNYDALGLGFTTPGKPACAIPEPTSLLLLGTALAGVTFARRRTGR